MFRKLLHSWRSYRETAHRGSLALQLGPRVALDIGLDYPDRRAIPLCLYPKC